jgi:hypothetical protein
VYYVTRNGNTENANPNSNPVDHVGWFPLLARSEPFVNHRHCRYHRPFDDHRLPVLMHASFLSGGGGENSNGEANRFPVGTSTLTSEIKETKNVKKKLEESSFRKTRSFRYN